MSNIIDKIQVSGVTYDIGGSGGGKAIEAGRGISVTTGETADTVSFNLPISAGTGTDSIQEGSGTIASGNYSHAEGYITSATTNYSHAEGNRTLASGNYSHAEGFYTKASGNYSHAEGQLTSATTSHSHAEGYKTITKNDYEHAACRFNKSTSADTSVFGHSGNTLFSIGNGNGNSEGIRHNALEARQNGDIYIANTNDTSTSNFYEKPMVKLQDYLASPTEKSTWNSKSDFSGDYNDLTNKLSAGTNITIVDNVISATSGGGGNPTVELTQAEYDALVTAGTVSADTYYIITDAQAGDLTNYYTKTEVDNAITAATSTKQDTLVSGTNIKTINNESLLGSGNIDIQGGGGGGKAIEAGRGISITTGATADTVSFSLPISAGTGTYSIQEGSGTKASGFCSHAEGSFSNANGSYSHAEGFGAIANGNSSHAEGGATNANGSYSHAEGDTTNAKGNYSHTEGHQTIANNLSEHASGQYNISNTGSTNADKTLFSVGNGTTDNARHNAFEIRQNGDIYISSGGTDILLQDHLGGGGGGSSYTAGRGIDITNDTISFSLPISAGTGTNALIFASDTYDLSNRASGNYSVSLNGGGYHATYAKGVCSVAEGMDTYAYQSGCHAEGHSTKAGNPSVYFSMYAHAEGDATYAYGQTSHSEGYGTTAATDSSHAEGRFTVTKNNAEHASGQYNNSVSASTTFGDSGNTLFSVGNGTSTSARHNAFEIRQNGDIYCSDGTNDVKLQDTITATAANTTALGGLSLVKLTQSAYDALATKDSNTLYVIVN